MWEPDCFNFLLFKANRLALLHNLNGVWCSVWHFFLFFCGKQHCDLQADFNDCALHKTGMSKEGQTCNYIIRLCDSRNEIKTLICNVSHFHFIVCKQMPLDFWAGDVLEVSLMQLCVRDGKLFSWCARHTPLLKGRKKKRTVVWTAD